MRLYHGSNIAIDNINLAMCRPYKDFGQGFYLTDIEEQAQKMAARVARIYGKTPIISEIYIILKLKISGYRRQKNGQNL